MLSSGVGKSQIQHMIPTHAFLHGLWRFLDSWPWSVAILMWHFALSHCFAFSFSKADKSKNTKASVSWCDVIQPRDILATSQRRAKGTFQDLLSGMTTLSLRYDHNFQHSCTYSCVFSPVVRQHQGLTSDFMHQTPFP